MAGIELAAAGGCGYHGARCLGTVIWRARLARALASRYSEEDTVSDFITLSCPNCAGKLSVAPESASLVCPSCGNEYLVRRDAGNVLLEGYARCPRCGRNDQVKAASAIVREQTVALDGVVMHEGQSTALATALAAPVAPLEEPASCWVRLAVVLIIVGALAMFLGLTSKTGITTGLGIFFLLSGVIGVLPERHRLANNRWAQPEHPRWERAMTRWQSLYYCARDDCVFIPGENQAVPLAQMHDYLYRGTDEQ